MYTPKNSEEFLIVFHVLTFTEYPSFFWKISQVLALHPELQTVAAERGWLSVWEAELKMLCFSPNHEFLSHLPAYFLISPYVVIYFVFIYFVAEVATVRHIYQGQSTKF